MKKHFLISFMFFVYAHTNAQIIRIDGLQNDTAKWQISFNGEFQSIKNKTVYYNLTGESNISFNPANYKLSSLNSYEYVFGNNEKITQQAYQHFRFQYHISHILDIEAFGQIQTNPILRIKQRTLAGSGIRFEFRQKKKFGWVNGISLMYESEKEIDTTNTVKDLRASLYLIIKTPIKENLKFYLISYYQFIPYKPDDYRISLNATLDILITKKLSFYIAADLIYDSNPFQGVINLTYYTKNGIKYLF